MTCWTARNLLAASVKPGTAACRLSCGRPGASHLSRKVMHLGHGRHRAPTPDDRYGGRLAMLACLLTAGLILALATAGLFAAVLLAR